MDTPESRAERIDSEYNLTKAILCELIWRCNLNPTREQYIELLGSENIRKLQLYVSKLWDKTKIKPVFNDEDFVFISNHPIDLNNIMSSAEGIVLRKTVSLEVLLSNRLESACCVVFVRARYCDRCNAAINFLERTKTDDDRIVVVDINTLEEHQQEILYKFSNDLPIIFIGQERIKYELLTKLSKQAIQAKLATCRGKIWQ